MTVIGQFLQLQPFTTTFT